VRFGRDVVVRGDASIAHAGVEPLLVPDGTHVGGSGPGGWPPATTDPPWSPGAGTRRRSASRTGSS
jgi:hypothetical protein